MKLELNAVTPPQTPQHDIPVHDPDPQAVASSTNDSRQKRFGRKLKRKSDRHAYRTISALQAKIQNTERRCAKYRKRLQRAAKLQQSANETPRSKTRRLLRGAHASTELRRTLLFHNTFVDGIREKYQHVTSTSNRKSCSFAVCSKLLKKYHMMHMCSQATGIPYKKSAFTG